MDSTRSPQNLEATVEHAHEVGRQILDTGGSRILDAVAWLSAHLVALDRTVHREVARRLPDGAVLVKTQRRVGREVERLLRVLERQVTGDMLTSSVDVIKVRERIDELLEEHRRREHRILDELSERLSDSERTGLADKYNEALRHAPTRPHPAAPHSGPLGGLALRFDAARDRIRELLDAHQVPMHEEPKTRRLGRWGRYVAGDAAFTDRSGRRAG